MFKIACLIFLRHQLFIAITAIKPEVVFVMIYETVSWLQDDKNPSKSKRLQCLKNAQ